MEKIKINLLPIEFTKLELEQSKFKKIQLICFIIVLILAIIAVAIFVARFLQSKEITNNEIILKEQQQQVETLKNKETTLTVLKNRITTIESLTAASSKQKSVYNLLSVLIPANISISSMIIDKNANASISISTPNSTALADFLQNLTSLDKNEDKIQSVEIDSISRNRDGSIRSSLKVKAK